MNSDLHARMLDTLQAHGILTLGGVTAPPATTHATLRDALRRRYPAGLASYVFWRAGKPDELHCSSAEVAATVRAAADRAGLAVSVA
jgi:hypothetical protein